MICKYLKSHLLGAPRECVLHGLNPGLDWASFWPSTPCAFHVATPHSVSCCLSQLDQVSHLSPSLLSGWLLTNVQVNNTTKLYDTHGHTYIHHIGISILLSSFLLTPTPSFLAGQLVQTFWSDTLCCLGCCPLGWQLDSPLALSFKTLGRRWALLYWTSLPRLIISRTIW
jgi:hypothetical protein